MRNPHNTIHSTLLKLSIDPSRLKALIEQAIETEDAVCKIQKNIIPDEVYFNKRLSMIEAQIFCIMLSED